MALGATTLALSLAATGATSVSYNRRIRAFTTDTRCISMSPGAATLYGVNHPGRLNTARVFRFKGDGSTVTFTLPTAATGVTYPTTNAASLTAANRLQAIALQLPSDTGMEINATNLLRVGSDATPGAGEFLINGTTVTVGTAVPAGKWLEVIVPDTANIVTINGGAFTADVPVVHKAYDFFANGVAITNITPYTH